METTRPFFFAHSHSRVLNALNLPTASEASRKDHEGYESAKNYKSVLNDYGNHLMSTLSIIDKLASRAQKRSIVSVKDPTVLKEPEISYSTVLGAKKGTLSHKNVYFWR